MKMKFWLIQRGKWNPDNKPSDEIKGLTGKSGLIDLDYMGSDEFEFGAIPKAYRRIMAQFDKYELFQLDILNPNGVPLNLYCRIDMMQEITDELKNYINNRYHLKEYSDLNNAFAAPARYDDGRVMFHRTTRFWWEVDNGLDFMCFIGAQDRRDMFMETINKDYNNWWMMKTDKEREDDIAKSF